jgi:hypothetical protein
VKGAGAALSAKSDESSARQDAFHKTAREWIQKRVMDAAEGGNRMINDWRYGPKKTPTQRTDGSGAVVTPKPATSSTKPNTAVAPRSTGIPNPGGPNFNMPPLPPLIPNNGSQAAPIPFQVNGAPAPTSGAKTMPGGAIPPPSNRIVDPNTGAIKYKTPAEMAEEAKQLELQQVQQEPEPAQ